MRKTWEIQRHRISKSHHEAAREDPGWEDQKESGARIRGRTTGIQKRKRKDLWDVCIKTAGLKKRLEMQGRMAVAFVDLLRKMVYADDLVKIAENKQELQEMLEEWKRVFKKHGCGLDTRERS